MTAGSRAVWRQHDFALLWLGQTVSEIGSQVTLLAFPTLAIFAFGAGPAAVGLLVASSRAPFPVFGLVAGAVIDRVPKRPVLIVCNLARLMILVAVPLTAEYGVLQLWELFAAAVAMGTFTVFYDIGYLALVPSIVDSTQLLEANSRLEMSFSGSSLIGPGLGGLLIQGLGAARAVLADTASFAVSVVTLLLMRVRDERTDPAPRIGLRREIGEGLRHVFGHRVLRAQLLGMSAAGIFAHMCEAPLYIFAYGTLHLSPGLVGLLLASEGAGALVGSVITGRIIRSWGVGRTVAIADGLATGLTGIVPLAVFFPTPLLLFVPFVLIGCMGTAGNIAQITLRQSLSPARLQGRMTSVFRTFFWGVWPLGNLIGGLIAAQVGAGTTLWVASLVGFFASVSLLATPLGRVRGFGGPGTEAVGSP